MKGIITLVALITLMGFVSCNAFKDYYDEGKEPVVPIPAANEQKKDESGSAGTGTSESVVPNFASDETPCEANEKLTATIDKDQGIVGSTGWTLEVAEGENAVVIAEKLGQFTTKITIAKELDSEGGEAESLTFTVKQVGEDKFNVCDVSYKGDSVSGDIESGNIVLDKFNEPGDSGKILNSAYYNLSFKEESGAEQLQGVYCVDALKATSSETEAKK